MTFNAAIPLNSDSPSIFPAQSQTNYARLQTLVGADHQFNPTAAANDGYHNLIHMTLQAPTGALASTGRLYGKSSAGRVHAFYMDDTGADYQITPTMPIRAAVNFNGLAASVVAGKSPMRSNFNVTDVTYNATGDYTINFTTAMPDANYIVQICGMRGTTSTCNGMVKGNATYGTNVKTTSVRIFFEGGGGGTSGDDVLMGNVVIMSAT